MRSLLSFLACFVLTSAAGAATSHIHVDINWRVTIDPLGHVTAMTAAPKQDVDRIPQIRTRLEQEVRTWQFLPGMINGKPVETRTGLRLSATLIAASDNAIRIQLDHADVGGTLLKAIAPRYPAKAIRMHRQGEVVLRITYDANGNVISTSVYPGAPKADASLIEASEKVARESKFDPETVGGHGVAGEMVTPFCYTLGRSQSDQCDWKRPGSDETLRDGETLALNPAAKLLTDVAGRTL